MSTERQRLVVSGVEVEVVRKPIKNLHVGVYPPNGRVRIAAPQRLDQDAVRLAVVSRIGWIRRKQREFQSQERQSQREMVTGESHYFQGHRYLLDVVVEDAPPRVEAVSNTRIRMFVRPGFDRDRREREFSAWYRKQVRAAVPGLLEKWQPKLGLELADWRVRKMRTRWGSCNATARRIWLNTELAKKLPECLEYILVHEMVHLLERRHTKRFEDLMTRFMPTWRMRRDELNRAPLAHEDWQY